MNSEIKNDVTVAEILLAQIADLHDACSYMNKIFGYGREAIRRLEFNLGNVMNPINGIYDGYYALDLCLKKTDLLNLLTFSLYSIRTLFLCLHATTGQCINDSSR
jgi:hypothetical protein